MRVLHGVASAPLSRQRKLFLLLVAIAGVIVGLLGMHVLVGGSHAGHDAPPPSATAQATAMTEQAPAPAGRCGETGCDELGLMAATCALALLALSLLAPAAHRPVSLKVAKPWSGPHPLIRRPAPAPSLIVLSISRT